MTSPFRERLAGLLALLDWEPSGISGEVSPSDQMYAGDADHYRRVGRSALRAIHLALVAAGREESVDDVLDLPCGHGRVLRVLARAFPDARLTACDLDRNAVDFCARTFGATPAYSSSDPVEIRLNGKFDLLWCGSLLTHLDARLWLAFLRVFESVTRTGGVCVFTTHGRLSAQWVRSRKWTYCLDPLQLDGLIGRWDRTGFGYVDYPGQTGYGISIAAPSWVCGQVEQFPSFRLVSFSEAAFDNHQDVVALLRV